MHTLNLRCYKQELLFLELIEIWSNFNDKSESSNDVKRHLNYLKKQINENEFFDDDDGFEFSQKLQDKAKLMTVDTLKTKYKIN